VEGIGGVAACFVRGVGVDPDPGRSMMTTEKLGDKQEKKMGETMWSLHSNL
jgi:hypothetical protein